MEDLDPIITRMLGPSSPGGKFWRDMKYTLDTGNTVNVLVAKVMKRTPGKHTYYLSNIV